MSLYVVTLTLPVGGQEARTKEPFVPAFPGTVRVAGTLSATDGAVIVTEDRLSLQAGEDHLGNWSLDTLDVAHKGHAITISIDGEIVVFMTANADELVEAVAEGARRAAETAAVRNDRIMRRKRPRIGRKASAKRKIELFDEHQQLEQPPAPPGAGAEPGADPWLQQITMNAPLLTPVADQIDTPDSPSTTNQVLTDELSALTTDTPAASVSRRPEPTTEAELPPSRTAVSTVDPEPEPARTEPVAPSQVVPKAPRRRVPRPQLRPSLLAAIAAVAVIVTVGVFFTEAVTMVTLGIAGLAIMVAIAGIMDQAIELRLPKQLSVTRLFGLGLALLAATMALTSLT